MKNRTKKKIEYVISNKTSKMNTAQSVWCLISLISQNQNLQWFATWIISIIGKRKGNVKIFALQKMIIYLIVIQFSTCHLEKSSLPTSEPFHLIKYKVY